MKTNETKRNGGKKHPFERVRRRARLIYLKIMRIDDPPERIARGAAIGVLMGVLPTFGIGTFLSLAGAFVFKANKAAAVLGSLIVNPLTSPFFWTLSIVLGSALTGQDSDAIFRHIKENGFLKGAGWTTIVYMTGNAILSAAFTIGSYYIVKIAIIRHRRRKEEKMLRKKWRGEA